MNKKGNQKKKEQGWRFGKKHGGLKSEIESKWRKDL